MMSAVQYSFSGYRNKLRMSRNRFILVEGADDQRAFKFLLERAAIDKTSGPVVVDRADILKSPEGTPLGNNDKVERFCAELAGTDVADRLVGFVDRGFRKFDLDGAGPIRDCVGEHHIAGRLVWSRGHSIENYMFSPDVLRDPLEIMSCTVEYEEPIRLFTRLFDSSLRVACAVSLAARDVGYVEAVRSSICWTIVQLGRSSVGLQNDLWRDGLTQRVKLPCRTAEAVLERYFYWLSRVGTSDPDTVRWACHGHVGLRVLWAVYERCAHECFGEEAPGRVLQGDEGTRFNACAQCWAKLAVQGKTPSPLDALTRLGICARVVQHGVSTVT